MTFLDFYDLAVYGNENWKGNYTAREVASNAYDYLLAYENGDKYTLNELCRLLEEDGSEECQIWLNQIKKGARK